MHQKNLPYLEKLEVLESTIPIQVRITGHWPTPNWSHDRTEIEKDENNRTITIYYCGKSKSGIALQVLQPWSDVVTVSPPLTGEWTIRVQGRTKELNQVVFINNTS